MPDGKPAGVRCIQLDAAQRCRLFGHPHRPEVCVSFGPASEMCGESAYDALIWLDKLEKATG